MKNMDLLNGIGETDEQYVRELFADDAEETVLDAETVSGEFHEIKAVPISAKTGAEKPWLRLTRRILVIGGAAACVALTVLIVKKAVNTPQIAQETSVSAENSMAAIQSDVTADTEYIGTEKPDETDEITKDTQIFHEKTTPTDHSCVTVLQQAGEASDKTQPTAANTQPTNPTKKADATNLYTQFTTGICSDPKKNTETTTLTAKKENTTQATAKTQNQDISATPIAPQNLELMHLSYCASDGNVQSAAMMGFDPDYKTDRLKKQLTGSICCEPHSDIPQTLKCTADGKIKSDYYCNLYYESYHFDKPAVFSYYNTYLGQVKTARNIQNAVWIEDGLLARQDRVYLYLAEQNGDYRYCGTVSDDGFIVRSNKNFYVMYETNPDAQHTISARAGDGHLKEYLENATLISRDQTRPDVLELMGTGRFPANYLAEDFAVQCIFGTPRDITLTSWIDGNNSVTLKAVDGVYIFPIAETNTYQAHIYYSSSETGGLSYYLGKVLG